MVRIHPPPPRRRVLHIVRDGVFFFKANAISPSFRRSSLSKPNPLRWASVWGLATSFFIKTCHSLILLLLASKCDPFRWARIWQKADILLRSVDPFITRCKRHMACSGFLCPENQRQDDSRMRRRGLALCRGGHWIFRQKIIPLDKDKAGKILYNRQCKAGGVCVRTKTRIGSQDHEV